MAVNVDTVYQRVLAIANKEQRGYITPQEYNLLANQAQMQIFESYFFDKNHRERLEPHRDDVNSETDLAKLLDRKLAPFITVEQLANGSIFPAHYQIGKIFYNGYECREVSRNEVKRMLRSARHTGTEPMYISSSVYSGHDIEVYNNVNSGMSSDPVTSNVTCEVITKPSDAAWGYVVVNNKALYNANTSTNFTLHESEEDTLVIKILELAGIVMNKPGLVQIAANKDTTEKTIQKA